MEDEIELIDYIKILIKKRVFIIGCTLLFVLISAAYSLTLPQLYAGIAKILIIEKPRITVESDTKFKTAEATVNISTYIELINNQQVVKKVKERLQADHREKKINLDLIGEAEIEQITGTNIIKLIFFNENPDLSALISNIWAKEFIDFNNNIYSSDSKGIKNILQNEYDKTKRDIKTADLEIMKANEEYDPATKETTSYLKANLIDLTKKLNFLENIILEFEIVGKDK